MHALAEEFLRRGHRVTVVASADGAVDREMYESKGIQFLLHRPFRNRTPKSIIGPILYAQNLAEFLKTTNRPAPDLILSFHYVYAAAAKTVWPNTPVGFLAGAAICDWLSSLYGHRNPIARAFLQVKAPAALYVERRAMSHSDKVYVESEMLRQRFLKFHPHARHKLAILPAPVDTGRFLSSLERRHQTRSELQIPETSRVILAVGRLDRNKNFGMLMRAARLLPDGDWVLLIVGEGPDEVALRELSLSLRLDGRVKFLGHRRDIEALYSSSDMLVHPSILESYGNVVLEAMATALPCIVSNGHKVGVSYDLRDGENALLADPQDPSVWAEQIQLLMSDGALSQRIGRAGRAFCEARSHWEEIADRLLREVAAHQYRLESVTVR